MRSLTARSFASLILAVLCLCASTGRAADVTVSNAIIPVSVTELLGAPMRTWTVEMSSDPGRRQEAVVSLDGANSAILAATGKWLGQPSEIRLECDESVKLQRRLREGTCMFEVYSSSDSDAPTKEYSFSYRVHGDATEDEGMAALLHGDKKKVGEVRVEVFRSEIRLLFSMSITEQANNAKKGRSSTSDSDGDREEEVLTIRSAVALSDSAPAPSTLADRWGFPAAIYVGCMLALWLWALINTKTSS